MAPIVVGILLFENYETLDAHGPIELLGNTKGKEGAFKLVTVAEKAGIIKGRQGVGVVAEYGFSNCPPLDVLLVPGGTGVRAAMENAALIKWVQDTYRGTSHPLQYLLSVCTGSWILAHAGLLDGRKATSNKQAWKSLQQFPKPQWVRRARWVEDGDIITSSGVTAGMDMTLYFISKLLGEDIAKNTAEFAEYSGSWDDSTNDPWADQVV